MVMLHIKNDRSSSAFSYHWEPGEVKDIPELEAHQLLHIQGSGFYEVPSLTVVEEEVEEQESPALDLGPDVSGNLAEALKSASPVRSRKASA